MQAIARDVYFEDQYLGVTLGAINLPRGLIQIDAPPSPEDGRAWRADLLSLGGGSERLLVQLDAHPDRTLGARAMECTVIAHEKATQVFRSRPTTFKAQGEETGADWENISGLGNIRWVIPEISFNSQLAIYWDDAPVLVEHHPGPSIGASWVILPEVKVVFVGDAIVRNQPPFLASADLPAWVESLKLLLSPAYRGYLVVSGRSGLVPVEIIRTQIDYLNHMAAKIEKLAAKSAPPEAVQNLISSLLAGFKVSAGRLRQFNRRLQYGLYHYYIRHYHPDGSMVEEV